MRALPAALVTLSLALIALATTVSAQQLGSAPPVAAPYRVIVNPQNTLVRINRTFLQDAFLKKKRHWPNDKVIHPVDLVASSRVRSNFSEGVLKRSVAAVKAYWQQRIFAGRDTPPPEFDSDEKIVAYVLKYEGAVGYVSGTADVLGARIVSVDR
jgi:ABC-type phosphate transport system substrate-binding protein